MSKELIEKKYLKEILEILKKNNLDLYELNWIFEHESNVLQILVENSNSNSKFVNFDNLVAGNEAISTLLDDEIDLKDPYILEVSSAGAERQVKQKEVLIKNIDNYFHIKSNLSFENINEFDATLEQYDKEKDEFVFSFFIKGRPKKVKLRYEDINFIRFAIKF
ncbi:ribosome assembly cofactor RimP [Spiroplasma tabanidicola]|uniref:Ribosome maturation factor RimP n=1 Tax=Spiroplasma tabanidicola TaxID=324079 RepID=A0A6I6CDA4_9MOLU|nr:ribosome assembly cofactor RimP [Spiroplasma tabanidicola]QGS52112.1 ribosome maturation factor RimP [Spiroplasma tabanidicola]